ncbi:MAG: hypothetical protein HQ539_00835 [Parcubacteria group bacterium]|nr:hypothetical protein [Parcubacteria group bacterium]
MTIQKFIKKRPYLFWSVKDLDNLSEESIVENVLNYGDFDDIRKMIKILKIQKTAKIFNKQIKQKRNNYDPKIVNYFKLYFKKYA